MNEKTRTKVSALVLRSRKNQITVALLTFFFIAATVLYMKANTIQVEVDGEEVQLTTLSSTIEEALEHSRLKIYPEDIVEPNRSTVVSDNMKVKIKRSIPVTITVDEKTYVTRTPIETVGPALKDLSNRLDLSLKETDEVNWDQDDLITADMELIVRRSVPIRVKVDGKELDTEIAPRTVEEALEK